MATARVIDQQEELRKTFLVETIDLERAKTVKMPFGNFLRAEEALDLTTVEIDRSARASVEVRFSQVCVAASTSGPTAGSSDYALLFWTDQTAKNIKASPITSISGTTVYSGTSASAGVVEMRADLWDNTLWWITDTQTGSQRSRVWKADYNNVTGALTGVSTVFNNLGTSLLSIDTDTKNDAVYFSDGDKVRKYTPSTGTVSTVYDPVGYPRALDIANTTYLYIAAGGQPFGGADVYSYNLATSTLSTLIDWTSIVRYIDVDRDFGAAFYRVLSTLYVRSNNLQFDNASNTYLLTPNFQNQYFVDKINKRIYYVDVTAAAVKRTDYAKFDEVNIGSIVNPSLVGAFTAG